MSSEEMLKKIRKEVKEALEKKKIPREEADYILALIELAIHKIQATHSTARFIAKEAYKNGNADKLDELMKLLDNIDRGKAVGKDELIKALKSIGYPERSAVALSLLLSNPEVGGIVRKVMKEAIEEAKTKQKQPQEREKQRI